MAKHSNGLIVNRISKSFNHTPALQEVSCTFQEGKTTAVLGPSGCGKSTLLAIIAGLVQADSGELFWDGEVLNNIPAHKREFGLMFQDYALFPHMNVYHNVAFGLRMKQKSREEIDMRVNEVLELVKLSHLQTRDISTLSGGESQRVALARTLAPDPKLLMLDEPLGSLDRKLRDQLLTELNGILRELDITTIYVTHDQEEAFTLADEIIVMQAGKIEQTGTPEEIYLKPANQFVAEFLGFKNLIPAFGKGDHAETSLGILPLPKPVWGKIMLLMRPEGLRLDQTGKVKWKGTVVERKFLGSICQAVLEIKKERFTFNFPTNACLPSEENEVNLSFDPEEFLQILNPST